MDPWEVHSVLPGPVQRQAHTAAALLAGPQKQSTREQFTEDCLLWKGLPCESGNSVSSPPFWSKEQQRCVRNLSLHSLSPCATGGKEVENFTGSEVQPGKMGGVGGKCF